MLPPVSTPAWSSSAGPARSGSFPFISGAGEAGRGRGPQASRGLARARRPPELLRLGRRGSRTQNRVFLSPAGMAGPDPSQGAGPQAGGSCPGAQRTSVRTGSYHLPGSQVFRVARPRAVSGPLPHLAQRLARGGFGGAVHPQSDAKTGFYRARALGWCTPTSERNLVWT